MNNSVYNVTCPFAHLIKSLTPFMQHCCACPLQGVICQLLSTTAMTYSQRMNRSKHRGMKKKKKQQLSNKLEGYTSGTIYLTKSMQLASAVHRLDLKGGLHIIKVPELASPMCLASHSRCHDHSSRHSHRSQRRQIN